MSPELESLELMKSLFGEAISRHGCDMPGVLTDLKSQLAALRPELRAKLDRELQMAIALGAPPPGGANRRLQ